MMNGMNVSGSLLQKSITMAHYNKWDDYMHNQFAEMTKMKDTECYVDVTIICEGKAVKLHKLVLSTCSPFFHKIFSSNPCAHPVIILQDIKFSILQSIINFIYSGEISFLNEELELLFKAANTLEIKGLPEICEELMLSMLTVDKMDDLENISPRNYSPDTPRKKRAKMQLSHVLSKNICLKKDNDSAESGEDDEFNSTHETGSFPMTVHSDNGSLNSIQNSMAKESPVKKTETTNSKFKRKRKQSQREKSSSMWYHFNIKENDQGQCKYCKRTISLSGGCFSNLRRHMKSKHPSVLLEDKTNSYAVRSTPLSNKVSSSEIFQKSTPSVPPSTSVPNSGKTDSISENEISGVDSDAVDETLSKVESVSAENAKLHSQIIEPHKPSVTAASSLSKDHSHSIPTPKHLSLNDSAGRNDLHILKKQNESLSSSQSAKFGSNIWHHFTKMVGKAKCHHCQAEIKMSKQSTGNLLRHAKKKHPAQLSRGVKTSRTVKTSQLPSTRSEHNINISKEPEEISGFILVESKTANTVAGSSHIKMNLTDIIENTINDGAETHGNQTIKFAKGKETEKTFQKET